MEAPIYGTQSGVDAAAGEMTVRTTKQKTNTRLEDWAECLALRTAYIFDCRYYHNRSTGETVFVGIGTDPEACGEMFRHLYGTCMQMVSEYISGPAVRCSSKRAKREAQTAFLFGVVYVVTSRMLTQKEKFPPIPRDVVAMKDALIKAAMPEGITTYRPKDRRLRVGACQAGRLAGESLPLATPWGSA